jgi:hypothetical protein
MLLWRQERMKAPAQQMATRLAAFSLKLDTALAHLEDEAGQFNLARPDIGQIAIACMLSYLDYRFADRDCAAHIRDWRLGTRSSANARQCWRLRPTAPPPEPASGNGSLHSAAI